MTTDSQSERSTWLLLREGRNAFDYNMALDEALLNSAPELGFPILRFYAWTEPAASFGYSQGYVEIEKLTLLRPLVRRPTGGGLVPHEADWTYSLVFPPKHPWYRIKAAESYRRVHEWLRDAFSELNVSTTLSSQRQKEIPGQCFVGAEKDDLLWHGRKIAGAAQRRSRSGLLVQGSVQPPPLSLSRESWEKAMRQVAEQKLGVEWKTMEIGADLRSLAENLRAVKYGRKEFNEKR
jgi:lipoate-protein ligase A